MEQFITIFTALQNGVLRAVCDGSFDVDYVTVAWCIYGIRTIIRGVNIVSIGSYTMESIIFELGGVYTIIRVMECLTNYYELAGGKIELGCDYEGGLKRILLYRRILKPQFFSGSHLDLVNSINAIIMLIPLEVIDRHVPGNQDDYCIYYSID